MTGRQQGQVVAATRDRAEQKEGKFTKESKGKPSGSGEALFVQRHSGQEERASKAVRSVATNSGARGEHSRGQISSRRGH